MFLWHTVGMPQISVDSGIMSQEPPGDSDAMVGQQGALSWGGGCS